MMDAEDQLQESSGEDTGTGSDAGSEEEEQSWIAWFCSIRGNEFFVEVEEDYIQDEFNLTGLAQEVPYFDYALDTILDVDSPNADLLTEEQQETVDAAAELLYGLIHARYILTSKGLHAMYDKFTDAHFGRCTRVYCEGQAMLPVGQSDLPRKSTVTLYCPRCNDIYYPKSSRHTNIDGAYFGTTFPHLFLMTFPTAVPPPPALVYVPRVFGFRVRREPIEDSTSQDASTASGLAGVRAIGPAGAAADARTSGSAAAAGGTTRMGRTREIATVLPPEAAAARRRAGQDDFMDEDEEEEALAETQSGSAAAATAGWGGTAAPGHNGGSPRLGAARGQAIRSSPPGNLEADVGDEEDEDENENEHAAGDDVSPSVKQRDAATLGDEAVTAALERLTLSSTAAASQKRDPGNGVDGAGRVDDGRRRAK